MPIQNLVSVVVATYNRAALLRRCIRSVVDQTYPDWELIVVDDGSTDGTRALVTSLARRYATIRYLRHPNRGQSLSLNRGIAASRGEWITFLDSDDAYAPEHLGRRVDWMTTHPHVDLIQGGIKLVGSPFVPDYYRPGELIDIHQCVVLGTFFGKREVFVELGGFRAIRYGNDTDLWARACARFRLRHLRSHRTYIKYQADDTLTAQELDQLVR